MRIIPNPNYDGCPFWLITTDEKDGILSKRWTYRYETHTKALDAAMVMVKEGVFESVTIAQDHTKVRA